MDNNPRGSAVPSSYLHSWKIDPEVDIVPYFPRDVKIQLKAFALLQAASTASFRAVDHTALPAQAAAGVPTVSHM